MKMSNIVGQLLPGCSFHGPLLDHTYHRCTAAWAALLFTVAGCTGSQISAELETAGDPTEDEGLAVVELEPTELEVAGITLGEPESRTSRTLQVTGTITFDQNRVSHVGPKTQGRLVELIVEVGSKVGVGDVLAHLESPEVGAIRAELTEAEALLGIATENYEREQRLEARGISSRRELLDAESELRVMQARAGTAQERLRVLGATSHGDGGHFDVSAPFGGTVVERHAGRGEVVGTEDNLFTVADLSNLWIELDIYERDLRNVRSGLPVEISTAAWPDQTFPGQISYVADILDPVRRSVRSRVEVPNPNGLLRPGMFAEARVQLVASEPFMALPREAVQTIEDQSIVWVPGDHPGEFVAQPVKMGMDLLGGMVEIESGLSWDDQVVVRGAFTLKAELSEGDFGGHGH